MNGRAPDRVVRFTDSKGCRWQVFERQRLCYDRRSVPVLIFESDSVVRCVCDYPGDWQRLEAEAVESLSWRT
jgi:hypothetical protein